MIPILLWLVPLAQADGCSLTVAAASDLAALERPIKAAIPNCEVRIVFGSSGMLSRQIEYGADYDVFLSASRQYVDSLVAANAALSETVTPYGSGRIALWSRTRVALESVRNLSIANPLHAPYGKAAKQALERQGLWEKLKDRIVYGENVRQAWQFASTGNTDAALTAWSLVFDKGGVLVDAKWHDPIVQVAVVPKRAGNRNAAMRFLGWLRSPEAKRLLRSHGFDALPEPRPAAASK